MKTIFLSTLVGFGALAFSACGGEATITNGEQDASQPQENIKLEVVTEKNPDGTIAEEYQVNAETKEKHGYYKWFHTNGKVAIERNYNKGVQDGMERTFSEDGKLTEETMLVMGNFEGEAKSYYPSGKIQQIKIHEKNQIAGTLTNYYENGNKKGEYLFVEGVENGPFKEWREDGTLEFEGSYQPRKGEGEMTEGQIHGLLKEYDEKGELKLKKKCEDNICCTYWTVADGDVPASSTLCEGILERMGTED